MRLIVLVYHMACTGWSSLMPSQRELLRGLLRGLLSGRLRLLRLLLELRGLLRGLLHRKRSCERYFKRGSGEMDDLFNGFMAFICIGATVILLLIAGVNIAHSNVKKSCERHGSFYIGDTRFECARTKEQR